MVRVCDGNTLPVHDGKIYMLRTYANSAHEISDVTNPSNPIGVRTVAGGNPVIGAQTGAPGVLAGTHKSWWECDTGIAYIVGQRGNDTADGWGLGNHIFIFDLSNPANPVYLRDWALNGQQPGQRNAATLYGDAVDPWANLHRASRRCCRTGGRHCGARLFRIRHRLQR
jgi:hypothetical protein